ncbi:hypothetical protein CVT26_005583 [Gymnopilus dilepis]|uniref:Rhodanese domain-containing protein n=1 Tax=Gymnopilus dilepis TaxID=231916 RepID=A0A409XZR7_9AGAR|nr:hypothetical protein CVT26_005583 [Gymnopilus dilepis]
MTTALPLEDYQRYGRQMILDGVGLEGQLKLRQSSVVVVGAGGLGCPALQYLGAAGVGRIGIIDHDRVELSNLQRQILHNEETLGKYKAESAATALKRLNSGLEVNVMVSALTSDNALSILEPYDIVLDCTDNVPTRYLLSDACVTLKKPLISGAAQKLEGQLCVFNLGPESPCYRCLYPQPPPQESVGSCAELGILGVVTGTIGNLQALEAIKIILGKEDQSSSLLLFSAFATPPFRSVKLRRRKPTCPACSNPDGCLGSTDYIQFCGGVRPDWIIQGRIPGVDLHEIITSAQIPPRILDVRPTVEFGICHLPGSENIPLKELLKHPEKYMNSATELYVICRLGNDSQIAAEALRHTGGGELTVRDVIGGLRAWSNTVDPGFPIY